MNTQRCRTVLIVEDCPEDREMYRRYLLRDRDYDYTILGASFGKQGLNLWRQHQPDAVLLDYQLPDLDGLEFLAALQTQPPLPIVMMTGFGSETIAVQAIKAGAQDYLVKEQITPESLKLALDGTIKTVQLQTQLQERIDRERVVAQIAQKVFRSLDLNEILQTTVTEVRQFLQTDRVVVFQVEAGGNGRVVAESVGAEWQSILSEQIYDPCFAESYVDPQRQGRVTVKADIYDGSIEPCHVQLLAGYQVRANLVVPILHDNQFWGVLIAHHCAAPRQWKPLEIDLLEQLSTQVSVAIRQAELYQQAQTELAERKQIEQALAERNQELNRFSYIVSHDLKAPLRGISNLAAWIREDLPPTIDPDILTNLDLIRSRVDRMDSLITGLLEYARVGSNAASLATFRVEQLLAEIVDSLSIPDSFVVELPAELPPITTNRVLLCQVLANLIGNAYKHHDRADGRIQVTVQPDAQMWGFSVTDDGRGIAPANQAEVFDIFTTLSGADKNNTGIGLSIVKKLVETQGGKITLESQLGIGTTFKFTWLSEI